MCRRLNDEDMRISEQIMNSRPKIGIALGGGVARSFANIGVLNVLAREGIPVDYLAGSSAASIIGAIYASGVSVENTCEIALSTRWKDVASLSLKHPFRGCLSNFRIERFLERHCRSKYFEDLCIPFGIVAADLISGEERLFQAGEIAPAVRASCSIPGIFPPIRIGKRLYIDGCYVNQIPSAAVRTMGAEIVIGCDVSKGALAVKKKVPRNMFTILRHLVALHSQKTADKGRRDSDLLIAVKVDDIGLTELRRKKEIIMRGEEETIKMLPGLYALFDQGLREKEKSCEEAFPRRSNALVL
ncbi:esterase [candidate division KSB3 bacterium]|uniref:Esterase n=1 Tax=candidate division KSB3 bacterium TaxID=2044937 RepID=A0A2G6E7L0_9BACT|nr:MAG: esterase [candidate division KSB3 bacterium]PIE30184.1 MAG: esterase [candidate division KSB3 bacterium]